MQIKDHPDVGENADTDLHGESATGRLLPQWEGSCGKIFPLLEPFGLTDM